MGQILRPLKTGNTRQYQTEVAAGHTDIIDVEVDGDLNTIYDEFNHRIDDSNIKAGANIAKSKLNLLNSIVNADVNTAAAIDWSKINHPTTFPADPATITNVLDSAVQAADHAAQDFISPVNGFVLNEATWTTSAANRFHIMMATMHGTYYNTSVTDGLITGRLAVGGTPGNMADAFPIANNEVGTNNAAGGAIGFPITIVCTWMGIMALGAQRAKFGFYCPVLGGPWIGSLFKLHDARLWVVGFK
jgi:hypothetical protein